MADSDLDELLEYMQKESDRCWNTAQEFRYVAPMWLVRDARRWDRWIAAVEACRGAG